MLSWFLLLFLTPDPPGSRSGEPVAPLQPGPDAGAKLQGPEGKQGTVAQGEAATQRQDQQRDPGAHPVAERRTADHQLHQRLQEHERLPHEEGTRHRNAQCLRSGGDSVMVRVAYCRRLADRRLGHGGQQEGHHGGRGV